MATIGATLMMLAGSTGVASGQTQTFYGCLTGSGTLRQVSTAGAPSHGFVFAQEWSDVRKRGECLGQPVQMNNIGQREYATLIKAAGVKRIKFHGLRHTSATLLLQASRSTSSASGSAPRRCR